MEDGAVYVAHTLGHSLPGIILFDLPTTGLSHTRSAFRLLQEFM
jgi:hypothetical protein